MPEYSQRSSGRLATCNVWLQRLFDSVILQYDNTVIQGKRSNEEQRRLFDAKRSKIKQGGKHNQSPSEAVDSAPYLSGRGIPWPQTPTFFDSLNDNQKKELNAYVKDTGQFYHYAGYVQGTANSMGIGIRWGGDWDRDHSFSDQTFDDLVHFETD